LTGKPEKVLDIMINVPSLDLIKDTEKKIKNFKIRGATNVAISAIKALNDALLDVSELDKEEVFSLVDESIKILSASRETEPMMRNGLKFMEISLKKAKLSTVEELYDITKELSNYLLDTFREAKERIMDVGNRRIHENSVIFTHCHSSSVTGILLRAKQKGKKFKVIQTETRPKYQGRITAMELVAAGIDTTMIVDSAARNFMKRVDFVLVGSDAITSEGNVINKIGTSQIAMAAHEARIPFYIVSSLLKFNPATIYGEYEIIEERDPDEIWLDPPKGLKIQNPAFDITRRDHIHGIITEAGIISPHSITDTVRRCYPWIID
jgi:ribose 1,5-bisphosphate isomerase